VTLSHNSLASLSRLSKLEKCRGTRLMSRQAQPDRAGACACVDSRRALADRIHSPENAVKPTRGGRRGTVAPKGHRFDASPKTRPPPPPPGGATATEQNGKPSIFFGSPILILITNLRGTSLANPANNAGDACFETSPNAREARPDNDNGPPTTATRRREISALRGRHLHIGRAGWVYRFSVFLRRADSLTAVFQQGGVAASVSFFYIFDLLLVTIGFRAARRIRCGPAHGQRVGNSAKTR